METPYGDFDSMLSVLEAQLANGPFLLGDTFSAADVLWGTALQWTMMFDLVPKRRGFVDYADRIATRPASRQVAEQDAAWAGEHEVVNRANAVTA
jgi:glutathione S-transferase